MSVSRPPSAAGPRSLAALSVASFLVVALLVAAFVHVSGGGMRAGHHNVDWAHHMALVDVLAGHEDPQAYRAQLGELADYPRAAPRR